VTRFNDHIYTQTVATSSYKAIVNLHTLQITRAHVKSSQSAFSSRFLITHLNNGDTSSSVLKSLLSSEYSTTELSSKLRPAYNPLARTNGKHSSSIVTCVSWGSHVIVTQPVHCHAGGCLATVVVSLFVLQPLPSNGSTRYNIVSIFRVRSEPSRKPA
jgi:hypothetical protein